MKEDIKLSTYYRGIDNEHHDYDHTNWKSFKEIEKVWGKKKCVRKGKRLYAFRENSIVMYERRKAKFEETKK